MRRCLQLLQLGEFLHHFFIPNFPNCTVILALFTVALPVKHDALSVFRMADALPFAEATCTSGLRNIHFGARASQSHATKRTSQCCPMIVGRNREVALAEMPGLGSAALIFAFVAVVGDLPPCHPRSYVPTRDKAWRERSSSLLDAACRLPDLRSGCGISSRDRKGMLFASGMSVPYRRRWRARVQAKCVHRTRHSHVAKTALAQARWDHSALARVRNKPSSSIPARRPSGNSSPLAA